jgi:hypothetical protein
VRCESEGFLPNDTSCGVKSTSADEGDLFTKYFSVSIAFAHNSSMNPAPLSMLLALSINVLFILSMNPFGCGVYGVVFWHDMPHLL